MKDALCLMIGFVLGCLFIVSLAIWAGPVQP